jgi:hypothetical protein
MNTPLMRACLTGLLADFLLPACRNDAKLADATATEALASAPDEPGLYAAAQNTALTVAGIQTLTRAQQPDQPPERQISLHRAATTMLREARTATNTIRRLQTETIQDPEPEPEPEAEPEPPPDSPQDPPTWANIMRQEAERLTRRATQVSPKQRDQDRMCAQALTTAAAKLSKPPRKSDLLSSTTLASAC